MLGQRLNKTNKVLCTCSKCCKKDTEKGIGLLIPKSTRTRHRKQENKTPLVLDLTLDSSSEAGSSLSISDIYSSSESESSVLVDIESTYVIAFDASNNKNVMMYVYYKLICF